MPVGALADIPLETQDEKSVLSDRRVPTCALLAACNPAGSNVTVLAIPRYRLVQATILVVKSPTRRSSDRSHRCVPERSRE